MYIFMFFFIFVYCHNWCSAYVGICVCMSARVAESEEERVGWRGRASEVLWLVTPGKRGNWLHVAGC
jgi:hypothetical protein